MRYLRRINESSDDFRHDIQDILLEIEDIGYETIIGEYTESVQISKMDDSNYMPLNFNEIKDCVLRLKDYLGNKYRRCEVHYNNYGGWKAFELCENSVFEGHRLPTSMYIEYDSDII